MTVKSHARHIAQELRDHAPFTILGAVLGMLFMLVFKNIGEIESHRFFEFFHPAHVILSAMVTASMFKRHTAKKRFIMILLVGFLGSIGIATLSDVVMPHIGMKLLGLDIPTHAEVHHHAGAAEVAENHEPVEHHGHGIHLGFIEEWYLVIPAAFLGVIIAFFLPRTKFPHAGHILVSTWASSAYLLMNIESQMTVGSALGIFVTLFLSVWLPCCISDIVFPLLFVGGEHTHNRKHSNEE